MCLHLPPHATCCHPLAGQIRVLAGLRLLVVSYCSNLAGCLLMVGLFTGGSIYPGRDHYLVHLGEAKCASGWNVVLVRGEWPARREREGARGALPACVRRSVLERVVRFGWGVKRGCGCVAGGGCLLAHQASPPPVLNALSTAQPAQRARCLPSSPLPPLP